MQQEREELFPQEEGGGFTYREHDNQQSHDVAPACHVTQPLLYG